MNKQNFKLLTRDLIDACGGLEEASKACGLSVGQLSRCQNPNAPDFLNGWAMHRLQQCAGKAILSDALSKAVDTEQGANLLDEVLDVSEAALEVQSITRKAAADGQISERERREIDQALNKVERQIAEARAANDRDAA